MFRCKLSKLKLTKFKICGGEVQSVGDVLVTWFNISKYEFMLVLTLIFKCFFLLVCPIWLPIFSYFFTNEPELGAGIDPGMTFNPFPSSIWIRQDSNPPPLDCESSSLTTSPWF